MKNSHRSVFIPPKSVFFSASKGWDLAYFSFYTWGCHGFLLRLEEKNRYPLFLFGYSFRETSLKFSVLPMLSLISLSLLSLSLSLSP